MKISGMYLTLGFIALSRDLNPLILQQRGLGLTLWRGTHKSFDIRFAFFSHLIGFGDESSKLMLPSSKSLTKVLLELYLGFVAKVDQKAKIRLKVYIAPSYTLKDFSMQHPKPNKVQLDAWTCQRTKEQDRWRWQTLTQCQLQLTPSHT